MENVENEKTPYYLYSIRDEKAEEYSPPFIAKNDKMACRMYLLSVEKLSYRDDLSLFKVGKWNPDGGYPVFGIMPEQIPIDKGDDD